MCGIVGIISKKPASASIIRAMNDTLIHRGPDDEGYLLGGQNNPDIPLHKPDQVNSPIPFMFAHRRQATIDPGESGHQPMSYLNRYWIVKNGAIYNYIELREELKELGYNFRSRSDTEVIMASYDAWGTDCLNKFNGMWAFVLYDSKTGELFISRDRFGIKPFYYYQDEEHFIFASEIKAILKHPSVPKEPNIDYCKQFLKEGPKEYLQETAFQNIYRLEPAHYLKCHVSEIFNQLKTVKYWEVIPNLSDEPYNEEKARGYAHQYMTLLSDAVKLRLRTDVKTGSSLSGGLDSSSVVWLVDLHLKASGNEEKQQTFSTTYQTPECKYCDESIFIEEMSAFLDLRSHTIEPEAMDFLVKQKKVVYYLDTPPESTQMSGWQTYFLARKNNVKVILEGQGADEQLGGYFGYLIAYYATIPLNQLILELIRLQRIPGSFISIGSGIILNILRHLFGEKRTLSLLRHFKISYSYMPLNKRLTDDLLLSLATLFHYADRGSMVHSIETRMPFMDYRLVEYLASVPASYKIHAGWTKYVARKAFNKKLPDSVCWRKDKMGWPVPEEIWFRGELKDTLIITILNSGFIEQCGLDQNNLNEKNIFQKYPLRMLIRAYILEIWFTTFWNGDNE